MKKFLSVLLTIAMVMSLFTGTVLAAPGPNAPDLAFTIAAGTASYDYNLKSFANTADHVSYVITEASGSPVIYSSPTAITVPATRLISINTSNLSIAPADIVKTYKMVITNTAARDHDDDLFAATTGAYEPTATPGLYQSNVTAGLYFTLPQKTLTVTITVLDVLTINGSTSNPTAVANSNNVFTGTLLASAGRAVTSTYIDIYDVTHDRIVASALTGPDGTFTINAYIGDAGNYKVRVGATELKEYKTLNFAVVEDLKLTVTNNPGSLRAATTPTHIVTFTVAALSTSVSAFAGTEPILVNVTLPNGTVVATTTSTSPTFTLNLDNGTVSTTNDLVAGTYTVNAVTYIKPVAEGVTLIADATASLPARTATTTFVVVDNTSALFVNTATINGVTKNVPVNVPATLNVPAVPSPVVLKLTAPTARTFKSVTYTVTGPLAKTLTVTDDTTGLPAVVYNSTGKTVTVIGGGVITLSGTATYDNDTTETFSKTFTVAGYVVEFTPATLGAVGTEAELKAVVTNAAGVPISNATVVWTSTDYNLNPNTATAFKVWNANLDTPAYEATVAETNNLVSGLTTVIQNGIYALKVKLAEPCIITATVYYGSGTLTTYAWNQDTVYGTEAYTVTTPATDLVATKVNQVISLKVVDANGTAVTPNWLYIDDVNAIVPNNTAHSYGTTTTLTFAPGAKTGTFNILLSTDSGKNIVTVPVNVVAPAVTVTVNGVAGTTITAGHRDKVVVTFTQTGATNLKTSEKTPITITGGVYPTSLSTSTIASPYAVSNSTVTIYPEYAIYDDATQGQILLNATYGTEYVTVATLTVANPTLDLDGVTQLEVGNAVDLSLTLTDANGVAMKDYVITANTGDATVTTDVDGKAVLTVSPTAVGKLTLEVTDLDAVWDTTLNTPARAEFAVTIPVVRDTIGPVITLDPVYTVTTLPSTITFQATGASEVWVDYAQAMVRPDGTVIFTVSNLINGVNTFDVLAYDTYHNATPATLTINYLAPSIVVMTIGSLDATRDGAPMSGMDQAPVIVNGRTFLPVRFVLQNLLGGTCNWDAATKTITSVVKGSTIKMVIGSKIAIVNGVNVALLEAPFIEPITWRTVVPMREIMEAIGCQLDWNAVTNTVTLTIPQ